MDIRGIRESRDSRGESDAGRMIVDHCRRILEVRRNIVIDKQKEERRKCQRREINLTEINFGRLSS